MPPNRSAPVLARLLGRAGILLTIAALGFVLGRGSAAGSGNQAAPHATASAMPKSSEPAVSAYIRQQALLGDPRFWLMRPARRGAALSRAISSPSLRHSVERSIAITLRSESPVGLAMRAGRTVLGRSVPLGYRVLSQSPRRSTFDVWVFSLLGGTGIPLDLRLVRYRIVEIRGSEGWRLAQTRGVGEGSAVRFRGAPELSARLAESLGDFKELHSEP